MGTVFKKHDDATATGRGGNLHSQGRAVRPVEGPQGQDPDRTADRRARTAATASSPNRRTYVAKYRDGAGVVQIVSTGCRDETAARQVLADLERKAELVRSERDDRGRSRHRGPPGSALAEHFDAFDEHHQAKGVTKIHREDTGRYLRRLAADCAFGTLADLRREALERWLALRTAGRHVGPDPERLPQRAGVVSATGASRRAGLP